MFYDGDIDAFFSDFAEDVTYAESGIAATTIIDGIFDSPGSVITIGRQYMVVEKPQVRVKSTDVPRISGDDTFVIRSTTYKVVNSTNDGTGITTVILAEGKR
jgi:hypothetical protein